MAFDEYRSHGEGSKCYELDIERFAYDAFAYMLSICGFPKAKIPVTIRKVNNYTEDKFIMNVGLSVLPIALYMRDSWKSTFEQKLEETGFYDILDVYYLLESMLLNCPDYEEEDAQSKLQFSLALYNEILLFFNYKNIETYYDSFPKLWSQFCLKHLERSNTEPLSTLLIMYPDVSETWILNFIINKAIPYGSSEGVSDSFSVYSLEIEAVNDDRNEHSRENVTDAASGVQESEVTNNSSEPSLQEDSNPGMYFSSGRWDFRACAEKFQVSQEKAFLKTAAHTRHTNGLTYVLHRCLKGRKRTLSLKLEVEDVFNEMSLEKENISPVNRGKRRRKISDKDELE